MASLQQSLHHYMGVTAWSPSRLEHRADGKATATSLSPEGHSSTGSMLCWGSVQHFSPVLSSGFSSSFSVQNSHLDFHVQQKARGDSFGLLFPKLGCPDLQGWGGRVWPAAPSYSTRACSTTEEPLPQTHPPCCDSFSLCKSSPALQLSPLPPAPVGLWSCRRVLEVQQGAASIPAACWQDHSTRLTQPWTTHTSSSQCCKPCFALPGHLQGTLQPSSRGCAPAVALQPPAVAVTEGCNSCNHCC